MIVRLSFTLCILLLPIETVLGFIGLRPFLAPMVGTNSQTTGSSVSACAVKSQQPPLSATTRNIFHEYDGPIILLGCSSPANELARLARSLERKLGDGNIVVITNDNQEQVLQNVDDQEYSWPDILVLDLTSIDKDAESLTRNLAEKFFEVHSLLSIFVNVDSKILSDSLVDAKGRMEQDVFVKYSDYELCVRDEGLLTCNTDDIDEIDASNWEHMEWELTRLIARARLIPAIPGDKTRSVNTAHLTMGQNTFFLSLSFPEISQVEPYVESMCQDVDVMEYRADLLRCRDSRFDILYGMQLLRRYCRPYTVRVPALPVAGTVIEDNIPIVYTVRTANQAGTFPDDEAGIAKMFDMLEWGLRGGVEVLDVESAWDTSKTDQLLKKVMERYSSQILGSHHVVGKEVTTEEAVELFEQCALNGKAHGAKVVLSIESEEKDRMAYEAALISSEIALSEGAPVIPHISLILGEIGQFSRIINLPFTPVTHESLPFKAAPGQLTASEIMLTRLLTKIFTSKKYCILGHNISYSVSPQMHGAAFAATRLPNEYIRVDVPTVEEFVESSLFKSDDFGGASVTIPHKQSIVPYVDVLSESAEQIGSVNTLIARTEFIDDDFQRVIYGDNTDWKGLYNPLNRILGISVNPSSDCALILGAGGTARAAAYVVKKLGLKPIYYNRTPAKAEELAANFGGSVVTNLEKTNQNGGQSLGSIVESVENIRVVISTLPAAAKFELPDWLLFPRAIKPIVFDVNYKPYSTALLEQADKVGCPVVRGSEMLWEQGVGQFELWTDRTAPYSVMKQVVLRNCQETPQEIITGSQGSESIPSGAFE